MNFSDPLLIAAIDELSSKFDILGDPIDLSMVKENGGEQRVFDALMKLYQPVLLDNQRILVVQSSTDIYSYQANVASDALIFLQKSLQTIDISNFFVIVISGNSRIKQELEWVQKHHSTDRDPIWSHWVPVDFEPQSQIRDSFCPMPWMHLYVNTRLEISPCCVADQNKVWGDLKKNTVMEIINSQRAKTMRLNMINDRPCEECEHCYVREKYQFISQRMRTNKEYRHLRDNFINQTKLDGSVESFQPISSDIRLNNICNLKCRTCDGQSSSKLAQEEKKLFNNIENYIRIPAKSLRSHVLDKTINYLNGADKISFAGGEPLIMYEHYDILDHFIKQEKTNIQLIYTTNFTTLIFRDKNVLDYWKKFPNIVLMASLDGHGPVFEYVRHGAIWTDIEKNLRDLKMHCPHVDFNVYSTISIFSAESVMELQQKWHEFDVLDIHKFKLNPVSFNDYFSLSTLFPHHKKYLSKKIHSHCEWLQSIGASELETGWKSIEESMWGEDKRYLSTMIAPINRARDTYRKENFKSLFPQFADLFCQDSENRKLNFV